MDPMSWKRMGIETEALADKEARLTSWFAMLA